MLHDLWQIGDLREVQQKSNSTASHKQLNFRRVVQSHSNSRVVTRKMMRQGRPTPELSRTAKRFRFGLNELLGPTNGMPERDVRWPREKGAGALYEGRVEWLLHVRPQISITVACIYSRQSPKR